MPLVPFNTWVMAARPRTLIAAASPVILATVIAIGHGTVHWPAAVAALIGGLLIQIGTNFANDYFDFIKGADQEDRVGPRRATQSGLVTPNQMLKATLIVMFIAFLIGIYLVYRGGWPIVIIGLASLALAILYTGGPFPLAYFGLADLPAFLFFGPIAAATSYYVQAGGWSDSTLIIGSACGFFSLAFLSINNLRDMDEDQRAGKRTLIVLLGKGFGQWQYITSVSLATLSPFVLIFLEPGHNFSLLATLTFIMALHAIRRTLNYDQPRELISILGMTAKLQIIFTIAFGIGWFL